MLSDIIGDFEFRIQPAVLRGGSQFFRLQIGPLPSQGAALDVCRSLLAQRQSCFTLAEGGIARDRQAERTKLGAEWASIELAQSTDWGGSPERSIGIAGAALARQIADTTPQSAPVGAPGLTD